MSILSVINQPTHLGPAQSLSSLVHTLLFVMDSNTTNTTQSACNMPSSGTDSVLGLSLMDDSAILSLPILDFGEAWSLDAILAPWREFDLQSYASNAFKAEDGLCVQPQPQYSLPGPSPVTSTESLSPFNLAHVLDTTFSPVGYPGFAFLSPATMGQDTTLPFLVGSPSPADVIAHAARAAAQTLPGNFAPCGAASSLVCHPTVSSAKAHPVQAPRPAAQGGPMRQESLFTGVAPSAGKPLVSFALSRS